MDKKIVRDYMMVTIGIALVAFAVEYFYAPNNIAAGGVTGLAIVINKYLRFIPIGALVLSMNLVLFIVAFIFIGGNFGAKTIYASLGLASIMWFIEKFLSPIALTKDLMLASIFGTLISAIGMAIVFNVNASTGGTDILAKILNIFFHTDIGKSLLLVDFSVTLLAGLAYGFDVGLYSLFCVIVNGLAIDRVIEGFNTCKEVTVISCESKVISEFIMNDLGRGCTFLKAVSGYKKSDIQVLYAVLGRTEFIKLKEYIKEVDPRAFITVGEVHEVLGEGFKEIGHM